VFQDPYGSLNPRKRVKDIITEPMRLNSTTRKSQRYNKIIEILNMVELDESYLNKLPIQLTQGEQQRIGVARAFVTNPKLVVLDEPTSLLDIRFRGEIVLLLKRLQKETGCAFLFISHDLNIIYQLSHTVAVMYLGRIVEQGSADKVFNHPKHPYTKALLSATLFPNPEQPRQDFFLVGEVPSPVDLHDNECNFAARCPYATAVCRTALPKFVPVSEDQKAACFLLDSNL
jgi:oligopeptide/dipeptide ABC transporter ATP-binding protein